MADASKIITWLQNEFAPLQLATPDTTLQQIVDNAVRYWNNYSAYKYVTMVDASTPRVAINAQYNSVVAVYPSAKPVNIVGNYPIWSLLGIAVLGGMSSDLIMLSQSYNDWYVYLGKDFQWTFQRSDTADLEEDDPLYVPNYLYVNNIPSLAQQLCVVGTKRLINDWDEPSFYIIDWVQRYAKSLLMQTEGNLLRKSDIIGVKNDGQQMINEGREMMKELQVELAENGRWVVCARRF